MKVKLNDQSELYKQAFLEDREENKAFSVEFKWVWALDDDGLAKVIARRKKGRYLIEIDPGLVDIVASVLNIKEDAEVMINVVDKRVSGMIVELEDGQFDAIFFDPKERNDLFLVRAERNQK